MTYLTCTSSPSLLGKSAVKIIILFRLESGNFKQPDNDGTDACAFLSLKILIKNQSPNYTHDFHTIKPLIESLNFSFPININNIRDVDKCYDIDIANNLM